MKKLSKTEARETIDHFFLTLKDKSAKEIKKMKRLAMKHNIPLKEKRKLFCKHCLTPYVKPKIRIKVDMKTITCEHCGHVSRWKFH